MKLIFRTSLMALLFLICSCSEDDNSDIIQSSTCNDGIQNGEETGVDCGGSCSTVCDRENYLEGQLVSRLVLDPEVEYILSGPYVVRDGASLEMEAGTIIKALPKQNAYIAIAQGGKLSIRGIQENPVVITSNSENPMPGDWGGIIVCGFAPTNNGINARSELGDFFYGGNDAERSSGVIKYLRLEYTGETFTESKPFSALSLYGVGSFTTIENVQVYNGNGNGFELIGGTPKPEKLVAINGGSAGIKISGGWNGSGNSWYVKNYLDYGLLLGNNNQDPTAIPFSDGSLQSISLVGPFDKGSIGYTDGGGHYDLSSVHSSHTKLGIRIANGNESLSIDNGNFNIDPIEFADNLSEFSVTNYNGDNDFYFERENLGAGNKAQKPLWANGWTVGF